MNNRVFDIENLAFSLNINSALLKELIDEEQKEFPNDDMLMELHVVRSLRKFHREENKID